MAYGDGVFAVVDYKQSNTVIWSEDDGKSWETGKNLPSNKGWNGMAYGDGMFVAVAHHDTDSAAWSVDGKNWEPATLPSLAKWIGVAYGIPAVDSEP
jgi:hypothetical protein